MHSRQHGLHQRRWFDHATGSDFATCLVPFVGTDESHASVKESAQIRLGRRVLPHLLVHRRCCHYGCTGGETQGGHQIICDTRRQSRQHIRCCRRDQHEARPARQFDMSHRGLSRGVEQAGAHRSPGQGLEG